MSEVVRKDNESLDNLVRRFRKQCEKEGIFRDMKKHEYFEPPSVLRRKRGKKKR
ncbi:MAG: 30S ribosomal protein S21 A [candidate division WS2 bacterium]|uniref:Small ribosomal subunit protein bS21 n=1 Tax=Psychracetigena formicireducens TaxID=2986056 RepID=A0A9E2BGC2_PSYF1|nr:30S ribosomal protein S21 A [Candidatus Psychracetigena formicireducens]MBT9145083.1 30S ribosomal protein S21 A [Candidatus Psychracetigena formicireducens]MBT9150295.1 30S ribosomal protein S21 A [Candidatus Psychracetigena formicireducens]